MRNEIQISIIYTFFPFFLAEFRKCLECFDVKYDIVKDITAEMLKERERQKVVVNSNTEQQIGKQVCTLEIYIYSFIIIFSDAIDKCY